MTQAVRSIEYVDVAFSDEQFNNIINGFKTADCLPGSEDYLGLRASLRDRSVIIRAKSRTCGRVCYLRVVDFDESTDVNSAVAWIASRTERGGLSSLALGTVNLIECQDIVYGAFKNQAIRFRGYGFFFEIVSIVSC